ncbi:MAG: EamA family transporter RarD [Candidatus Hydrogenedentes bacterium]|nr:EamA family transporter RarD [Candidatus Hydrogenedentota bacterium]
MDETAQHTARARTGALLAASAFVVWGIVPIYFKQLKDVPPFEVIAHRVVWTLLFTGIVMLVTGRGNGFLQLLQNRRRALGLVASGLCIAANWLLFVWAVNTGRVLETSLGYFINPLLSIFLGMALLGERLRPAQYLAVTIAGTGVLLSLTVYGKLPWISLTLAGSFGLYGLLRKNIRVDAVTGLFTETLILLPLTLVYLGYLNYNGADHFFGGSPRSQVLLASTGVVTAIPLMLFAIGARRVNLSTIGILQYIAPSLSFLVAVLFYQEPLDLARLVTFAFVWAALAIYTVDAIHTTRRNYVNTRAAQATASAS